MSPADFDAENRGHPSIDGSAEVGAQSGVRPCGETVVECGIGSGSYFESEVADGVTGVNRF